MKRIDLIRSTKAAGCELVRHGTKHDWYRNPTTGVSQAIPRHDEIQEHLARKIISLLESDDSDQIDE